jgi:hypothetical protein
MSLEVLIPRLPHGLYGQVTSPQPSATVDGDTISVSGWIVSATSDRDQFQVSANGIPIPLRSSALSPLRELNAVPHKLRSRALAWECEADLTGVDRGPVRLDTQLHYYGSEWTILDSVCVELGAAENAHALGRITAPGANSPADLASLEVAGFAVHPDGPVLAVVISVNREPAARVEPGMKSCEAQRQWPKLGWASSSGWQANVPLPDDLSGRVDITAEALCPDGSWQMIDTIAVRQVRVLPRTTLGLLEAMRKALARS